MLTLSTPGLVSLTILTPVLNLGPISTCSRVKLFIYDQTPGGRSEQAPPNSPTSNHHPTPDPLVSRIWTVTRSR